MKYLLAAAALFIVASAAINDAHAAFACGPRGCVAGRVHPYARPYVRPYGGYYGRPYYGGRGCAWINGVRVCR